MKIVRDKRVSKAILNKIDKENNLKGNNYIDSDFGYVRIINHDNNNDASFKQTEYKGSKYKVCYFGGCFYPYITKID